MTKLEVARGPESSFVARFLTPATSDYSTSLFVISVVIMARLATHFLGSPDLGESAVWLRAGLVVVSLGPAFVVIWLFRLFKMRSALLQAIWRLVGLVFAGAMSGFVLFQMLSSFIEVGSESLLYRVSGTIFTVAGTIFAFTLAYSRFQAHRAHYVGLANETHQLDEALNQLKLENNKMTDTHVELVLADINAELERINLRPVQSQVTALEQLINEKVRPISREYSRQISTWMPKPYSVEQPKFSQTWASQNIFAHSPTWWGGLVVAVEGLTSAIYFFGFWRGLLCTFLGSGVVALGYWAQRRFAPKRLQKWQSPWREIALTISFMVIGWLGGLATCLALLGTANPTMYAAATMVMTTVFGWVATVASAYIFDTYDRIAKLEKVRDRLRWTLARVGMVSWHRRGIISRLLHGPVQNSLHATLIRLRDQKPEQVFENAIDELRERFAAVALGASNKRQSLAQELDLVLRLWADICSIEVELDEAIEDILKADEVASSIVLDLTSELISNAIRHGRATRMSILIELDDDVVRLRLSDNGLTHLESEAGVAVADIGNEGVGTKMLNSCTIAWNTLRVNSENQLVASVPCLR